MLRLGRWPWRGAGCPRRSVRGGHTSHAPGSPWHLGAGASGAAWGELLLFRGWGSPRFSRMPSKGRIPSRTRAPRAARTSTRRRDPAPPALPPPARPWDSCHFPWRAPWLPAFFSPHSGRQRGLSISCALLSIRLSANSRCKRCDPGLATVIPLPPPRPPSHNIVPSAQECFCLPFTVVNSFPD